MGRALAALAFAAVLLAQIRDLKLEAPIPAKLPGDQGSRWAVVVGVSSYDNLPPAAQLHFAHRDAEEFAEFLRGPSGGALPASHIRLLTNDQATLAAVRAALHIWLVNSAGPQDIVYVIFAGHGVLDDHDEGYFVVRDSDPQNLRATGLSFQEVDRTLSSKLRAGLTILVTDACHTGRLGWASYAPGNPIRAADGLAKIGQGDRSFLKLLASSPSERSFEDDQWEGGHGVFTHVLLNGLRGDADRDSDHVVQISEEIDYLSRRVPERTKGTQHPRVAGTFDAHTALAVAVQPPAPAMKTVSLDVSGPSGSSVYIDNVFRGAIRNSGILRIEPLAPGPHAFSADFPDGASLDGSVTLRDIPARTTIMPPSATPLGQLRQRVKAGQMLETGGAWDYFRSQKFDGAERAAANEMMTGALEELGQACLNDYVQSIAQGPKAPMLQRAVEAYERLQAMYPADAGYQLRGTFCRARLLIAQERFAEAVVELEKAQKIDSQFACTYNALGVAYSGMGRTKEARAAFETAAKLTPEWGLPVFEIASRLVAAGNVDQARPYLVKAVAYNPRSVAMRWNLLHVDRVLGRLPDVEKDGAELIKLNASYAPAYLELGRAYEAAGNVARAASAYNTYLQLAPNFADSEAIRARVKAIRNR
jgi:Flp pilus assembly protein TadD/uncharacterized caspase-like protein